MAKDKVTRAELEEIVMAEMRKHPDLAVGECVGTTRPTNANWDAAFVRHGNEPVPSRAFDVARGEASVFL